MSMLIYMYVFMGLVAGQYNRGDNLGMAVPGMSARGFHALLNALRMDPANAMQPEYKLPLGTVPFTVASFPATDPVWLALAPTKEIRTTVDEQLATCPENFLTPRNCAGVAFWSLADGSYCTSEVTFGGTALVGATAEGEIVRDFTTLLCGPAMGACKVDPTQFLSPGIKSIAAVTDVDPKTFMRLWVTMGFPCVKAPDCLFPLDNVYGGAAFKLPASANIRFLANWFGPVPKCKQVVIGQTAYNLDLESGTAGRGSYSRTQPDKPNECLQFFFKFVLPNGQLFEYPAEGVLQLGSSCVGGDYLAKPHVAFPVQNDGGSPCNGNIVLNSKTCPDGSSGTVGGGVTNAPTMAQQPGQTNAPSPPTVAIATGAPSPAAAGGLLCDPRDCVAACLMRGGVDLCSCLDGKASPTCAEDNIIGGPQAPGTGLGGGAIAGIIIGTILYCVCCIGATLLIWKRLPSDEEEPPQGKSMY